MRETLRALQLFAYCPHGFNVRGLPHPWKLATERIRFLDNVPLANEVPEQEFLLQLGTKQT